MYLKQLQAGLEGGEIFNAIIDISKLDEAKVVLDRIVFGMRDDWQLEYHCCGKADTIYAGTVAVNKSDYSKCKLINIYKKV